MYGSTNSSTMSTCIIKMQDYDIVTNTSNVYPHVYMCLGSSVGRAPCLEYRVSWVRVPPEAAHFF